MDRLERWGRIRMTEQVNRIEDMIKVFEPFPLSEKDEFQHFYVKTYLYISIENLVKIYKTGNIA